MTTSFSASPGSSFSGSRKQFKFEKSNKSSYFKKFSASSAMSGASADGVEDEGIPVTDGSHLLSLAMKGDYEGCEQFVSAYPEYINYKDQDDGNVALHIASSRGYTYICELLVQSGANINIQDYFGNSPLHYAVHRGRKETANSLIRLGANYNLQDFRGNSPLHLACGNNDLEMVKMLIKAGADVDLPDFADIRPREKSTLQTVHVLIENRLKALQGGDVEALSGTINWMGFGVGLGVGLGMAVAKQQQLLQERQQTQLAILYEQHFLKTGEEHPAARLQSQQLFKQSLQQQGAGGAMGTGTGSGLGTAGNRTGTGSSGALLSLPPLSGGGRMMGSGQSGFIGGGGSPNSGPSGVRFSANPEQGRSGTGTGGSIGSRSGALSRGGSSKSNPRGSRVFAGGMSGPQPAVSPTVQGKFLN